MAVSYQPRYRVTGSPTWINFGPPITVAPFTVTVTGLALATGYDFDVLAINSFGSTASSTVTATTLATESAEAFTVTTAGPIVEASQTMGVADPSGPWNTFVLQTSVATPPFVISMNGGTGTGANTSGLVYHNHTLFAQSTSTWHYWNTTTSAYTGFSITSVTLSNATVAASQPVGTVVGTLSTVMSDGSTFSGIYGVSDTTNFKIVGNSLETNVANLSGNFPITITAAPTLVGNSFTTPTITVVATAASNRRAGTRFPYPTAAYTVPAWPYAYNSVWNIGIGSGALFSGPSGSDTVTANLLSAGSIALSSPGTTNGEWTYPSYVGASSDTVFTWKSDPSWTGAGPSGAWPGQAQQSGTIHVPANAIASSDTDVLLTLMDSTQPTLMLAFGDAASLNRSNNTASGGNATVFDNSGTGTATWGESFQHMAVQGADLDNITAGGGIYRMLPCHIHGNQAKAWGPYANWSTSLLNLGFYNCVWPANASDYYGGTGANSIYSGQIPFGSIIFIPPSVLNMSTWSFGGTNPLGLSMAGMAIALQLQNYGWHVENTGGSFMLYTSWDVKSTTPRTTRYNELASVFSGTTLLQYMRVMPSWMTGKAAGVTGSPPGNGYQYDPNYNPSAPVNGGGTYPPPPPYWDPSLSTTFTSQNTY